MQEKGQIILILILIMTVALAIGLSVVQKSLVDVSTASKVEQSSRAFSAAEAGIEKALSRSTTYNCTDCQRFSDSSSSIKEITDDLVPPMASVGSRQVGLEFPALAKEDVAQVWLADFTSTSNPPGVYYNQSTLDVYWGNSTSDKAALEVTLVYHDRTKYESRKWYLDPDNTRRANNSFEVPDNCSGNPVGSTTYQCKKTLTFTDEQRLGQKLIRVRLLYNVNSQPFAVQATGTCGSRECSLPPQSRVILSTGVAGETQRRVQLFQLYNVVPHYFNYAIFSAGNLSK